MLTERLDQQQQLASASSTRLAALQSVQGLFTVASDSSTNSTAVSYTHLDVYKRQNQDTIQGTLDMTVIQRQAEMMQKALTVFHTEFNKIATEDLPKV